MKKITILFTLFLFSWKMLFCQDYTSSWKDHFSYYSIKDVVSSESKIYAAADNAVFSFDTNTNELQTITTVNGLAGETISKLHYSNTYELLIIGYSTGLMELVMDDGDVLSVVDILNKPTISPENKEINHFFEFGELIYISTNYGISVYNLLSLEFGDTYFIGNSGSQVPVEQTVVLNDQIYAACQGANGIKKALVNSPNLVDYQNWTQVTSGNYLGIQELQDNVYALRSPRDVVQLVNDSPQLLTTLPVNPVDFKASEDRLMITTADAVYTYNDNFNLISSVDVAVTPAFEFTTATLSGESIFIGTFENGLLQTSVSNSSNFEIIVPGGPLNNLPFAIEARGNHLWVTYGDYTISYNPSPEKSSGISHLNGEEWTNIPFEELLGARNLNSIAINPFNLDQVFICSFFDGILEMNNNTAVVLNDETNSGLLPIPANGQIRQSAGKFDSNGVLWSATAKVGSPLVSYDPNTNQWQTYSFSSVIPTGQELPWDQGFTGVEVDASGNKWMGGYRNGVIGYNANGVINTLFSEEQNMPSTRVHALANDKNNQLWIGTDKGLRVLYNTSGFFEGTAEVESIIILDGDTPEELLYQQYITDIEVDGSNNKWIATLSSGAFYLSANGQNTIHHFTKDNSPLPSNNINDISIDPANGRVYLASDKGIVSFLSGGSETLESLEDAFAFPNPVRPGFDINNEKLKIRGLSENVNIKILDIEGNLVAEAQSNVNLRYRGYHLEIDGGTAFWDGKNLGNNTVASGVYLVMLSDLDTFETKVIKVMVIRK